MGKLLHFAPRSSDFLIFGDPINFAPQHTEGLKALAEDFNAAYWPGHGFVAHRDVVESHPDYVTIVLFMAGFVGVL